MKLDELVAADVAGATLSADLVDALKDYGFVAATYTLTKHLVHKYLAIITGVRPDGSTHSWTGTGSTPREAEEDVVDVLAKWVIQNQQLPFTNPNP